MKIKCNILQYIPRTYTIRHLAPMSKSLKFVLSHPSITRIFRSYHSLETDRQLSIKEQVWSKNLKNARLPKTRNSHNKFWGEWHQSKQLLFTNHLTRLHVVANLHNVGWLLLYVQHKTQSKHSISNLSRMFQDIIELWKKI